MQTLLELRVHMLVLRLLSLGPTQDMRPGGLEPMQITYPSLPALPAVYSARRKEYRQVRGQSIPIIRRHSLLGRRRICMVHQRWGHRPHKRG